MKEEKLVSSSKEGQIVTLCFPERPTFGVGWPPVGTFDLQVIKAVEERVSFFVFFVLFCFFETGFLCVALAVLELTL